MPSTSPGTPMGNVASARMKGRSHAGPVWVFSTRYAVTKTKGVPTSAVRAAMVKLLM